MSGSSGDVVVLMGLYNGGAWLDAQLRSIAGQDHRDWRLVISDDGSTDDGPRRAAEFAEAAGRDRTRIVTGPQRGFAANYLSLLGCAEASQAEFVALCDQDDVWLPHRLSRGIAALRGAGGQPMLYCARTLLCDEQLRDLRISPHWPRPFSFANALVQNIASGNTIMLNRPMTDLARQAAPAAARAGIVAHDWWLYQLATATGARIVQDDQVVLRYRQHGQNTMGRNDTARAVALRARQIADGTFAGWIDANREALSLSELPLELEAKRLLEDFPSLRDPGLIRRLRALRRLGLYRQSRSGDLAVAAAVTTGRL